ASQIGSLSELRGTGARAVLLAVRAEEHALSGFVRRADRGSGRGAVPAGLENRPHGGPVPVSAGQADRRIHRRAAHEIQLAAATVPAHELRLFSDAFAGTACRLVSGAGQRRPARKQSPAHVGRPGLEQSFAGCSQRAASKADRVSIEVWPAREPTAGAAGGDGPAGPAANRPKIEPGYRGQDVEGDVPAAAPVRAALKGAVSRLGPLLYRAFRV